MDYENAMEIYNCFDYGIFPFAALFDESYFWKKFYRSRKKYGL